MKTAIIFGATGFIGSSLLEILLNDPDYRQVTIVIRKDNGVKHPRLKTLIGDFDSLPALAEQISADEIFITLGTTKKSSPDQQQYYKVDHDYPVLAAKMARARGANAVFIVTAVGANAKSGIFYVRTKGEVERDIIAIGFEHTHIFRPSMIMGNRKEHRSMEKLLISTWSVINAVLVGRLNIYKGIRAEDVAKAMSNAAKHPSAKLNTYHWKEMNALL